MEPLVSVIMPAYNRANVISEAIDSVLAQTYTNWELIVVDDRSTDSTKEVVERYCGLDHRVRYILNDRAKGPGGARNCGMLAAEGDCLSFLDSDDLWFDFHLQDSIRILRETKSDVSFALWVQRHGTTTIHNFDGAVEQRHLSDMRRKFTVGHQAILFEQGLFEQFLSNSRNFFQMNTMVFHKDLLEQVGLINEDFYLGEDTLFLIRFFDRCRIVLQTKPHAVYNESPDSLYFFCDRWQLNPDDIYKNKELLARIEVLGLRSVRVREQLKDIVQQSDSISSRNKRRCRRGIEFGMANKYYTLSYLHMTDRKRAIHYCRMSLRSKVHLFNLLLMIRLQFFGKAAGSRFLQRPLDLW